MAIRDRKKVDEKIMRQVKEEKKPRELRRLSRKELLELLLEQKRRADQLEQRVTELEAMLQNRDITIQKAGSIAEAALQINEVFAAADAAARQYVMNVRRLAGQASEQHEERK